MKFSNIGFAASAVMAALALEDSYGGPPRLYHPKILF